MVEPRRTTELHDIGSMVTRIDQRTLDLCDRFDKYLIGHSLDHGKVEERWSRHSIEAARLVDNIAHVKDHETRLRTVEDSLLQLKTMGTMIKVLLGTSVVGAALSLFALIELASRAAGS